MSCADTAGQVRHPKQQASKLSHKTTTTTFPKAFELPARRYKAAREAVQSCLRGSTKLSARQYKAVPYLQHGRRQVWSLYIPNRHTSDQWPQPVDMQLLLLDSQHAAVHLYHKNRCTVFPYCTQHCRCSACTTVHAIQRMVCIRLFRACNLKWQCHMPSKRGTKPNPQKPMQKHQTGRRVSWALTTRDSRDHCAWIPGPVDSVLMPHHAAQVLQNTTRGALHAY